MSNLRILIVDDMGSMRGVIRMFLADSDYLNIIEATDGMKALKILEAEKIDFIISDWDMPNMTGLELLQAVRGHEKLKELPFLMLTATHNLEKVQSAIDAGVTDYIAKPFQPQTLMDKLHKCLAK